MIKFWKPTTEPYTHFVCSLGEILLVCFFLHSLSGVVVLLSKNLVGLFACFLNLVQESICLGNLYQTCSISNLVFSRKKPRS
jgi:hypothetical protein